MYSSSKLDSTNTNINNMVDNIISKGDQRDLLAFKQQNKIFYYDEDISNSDSIDSNNNNNNSNRNITNNLLSFLFQKVSSQENPYNKYKDLILPSDLKNKYREYSKFNIEGWKIEDYKSIIEKILFPEKNKSNKCFIL